MNYTGKESMLRVSYENLIPNDRKSVAMLKWLKVQIDTSMVVYVETVMQKFSVSDKLCAAFVGRL